jgi:hypothetical protein
MKSLTVLIATGILGALPAAAAYSYCQPITIRHSMVPNTDQSNYVLTVNDTDPKLATVANGGYVRNFNGYDIVFALDASGVNLLSWDPLEFYDAVAGKIIAHVQVGSVSHLVDSTIYRCAGNTAVSSFQGGGTGAAWPAEYRMVWHLGNGTTLSVADSTANGNTGSAPGGNMAAGAGKIDGGAVNTTGGSNVSAFANPVSGSASVSFWINWSSLSGLGEPFDTVPSSYAVYTTPAPNKLHLASDSDADLAISNTVFSTGTWYKIDATYDGTTAKIYVNGALDASNGFSRFMQSTTSVSILWSTNHSFPCSCTLDEVRFSTGVLTSDRIATDYANQSNPSAFYLAGAWAATAGTGSQSLIF